METIQAKVSVSCDDRRSLAGYCEITQNEFAGMIHNWKRILVGISLNDGGLNKAYMLMSSTSAILLETDDDRYFVAEA